MFDVPVILSSDVGRERTEPAAPMGCWARAAGVRYQLVENKRLKVINRKNRTYTAGSDSWEKRWEQAPSYTYL
jgi:hypothetical protein